MTTIAHIAPTPAFASVSMGYDRPRRLAPGVGLVLAGLVSVALWAGLAQIVITLLG